MVACACNFGRLVRAAIVKLGHVAGNASTARGYTLGLHLCNTMFLFASLALTAWYATERPVKPEAERRISWMLIIAAAGIVVAGATGGITALGDTLFKSATLAEGIQQDFSEFAHPFVRLRVFHPALAAIPAVLIGMFCGSVLAAANPSGEPETAFLPVDSAGDAASVDGGFELVLLAPVPPADTAPAGRGFVVDHAGVADGGGTGRAVSKPLPHGRGSVRVYNR